MAASFSQALEELLNPLPKFADPEDDGDEATKAKVIEPLNEDDDGHGVGLSGLRRHNAALLSDTDRRYVGKPVSRKQLLMDTGGSDDDVDDDDEEGEDEEDAEDENDIDEEEEGVSVEEGEGEDSVDAEDENDIGDDDDEEVEEELDSDAQPDTRLTSKTKRSVMTFPQGVDFHQLTEGMDDLGVSEEDDNDVTEGSEDDEASDDDDDDVEDDGDEDVADEGVVRTFSKAKVDEEVEKGKAVRNQLALWDQLLEGRIKLQKALATANRLPQPQTFTEFKRRGGAELTGALKNTHKALKALQRSLLELQDQLLYQNTDTRPIVLGKTGAAGEDEEIGSEEDEAEESSVLEAGPAKRKLEMAEYPDLMAKRFAAFQPYSTATLQKWHDKTRLSMGKSSRGFGAFDRNIVTQVEQVLMDKERLLRRTQTRRSEYRVLGKKEAPALVSESVPTEDEDAEQPPRANTHLKDLDEDIFDDDDFYHQLLRELIERKTSAADPNDQVAMGRQWLAIQKLRSKIKKKVDTKASKGRKVRFHVHSKLVNFMAPVDHSSMSDEARSELYRGLLGQSASIRD